MTLKGLGVSKGLKIGTIFKLEKEKIEVKKIKSDSTDQVKKFKRIIKKVILVINQEKENAIKNELGKKELVIFDAHLEIANDVELQKEIIEQIKNEKVNVEYAISEVSKKYINMFKQMEDSYMQERAADIEDVARRMLLISLNKKENDLLNLPQNSIIVALDLTPSDTAKLDKEKVCGIVTKLGSKTSHASIIAKSLGIPAIVGMKKIDKPKKNQKAIIDGEKGTLIINPSDEEIKKTKKAIRETKKFQEELRKLKTKKSETLDGKTIELAANIQNLKNLEEISESGAEAIGLFRTEFLFMKEENWPSEDFQFQKYKEILKKMEGKKVVIRTLDIGGDKNLKYFQFEKELNPFLGLRAIRFTLQKRNIFKTQIRALLRASIYGKLAIMFPMIATEEELKKALKIFNAEKANLLKEGKKIAKKIEVGMMMEIPAAALNAKNLAKHVDFFSIGTNDLIQYTMAADRMNENVSYLYQPLHPSILRLIKKIIDGAHYHKKWVGICGEMASNSKATALLVGLGIDELSMSSKMILQIKYLISKLNFNEARKIALKAIQCSNTKEVEKLVFSFNKLK